MLIEVSNGEIIDKLSILKIKTEKLNDSTKRTHALAEYEYLHDQISTINFDINSSQYKRLVQVNEMLWDIEDSIRHKEQKQLFDEEFIELSRQIYLLNDERFRIKNTINQQTSSTFQEQKSHSTCY